VHETPVSLPNVVPDGLGVALIVQLLPFQCSASVTVCPALLLKKLPTAVHEVTESQDTPWKTTCVDPAGLGVLCITHFVPFHRSAKVTVAELALT